MNRRLTAIAQVLSQDGYQLRVPVIGGSMLPWIRAGDCLVASPMTMTRLIPGDLILFEREGQLVAHRLIRQIGLQSGHALVTKGDWMTSEDAPISPSSVIGKVIAIDRRGRRIRLDRGTMGLLMHVAGWILRNYPWLMAGIRRQWWRMKGRQS
jgi:hypothetical protein